MSQTQLSDCQQQHISWYKVGQVVETMHLGLATMVGNEVWEQWGANTGDAQQLQEQTETGVLYSLLRLLQSGPALMGHGHKCGVGRAGGAAGQ